MTPASRPTDAAADRIGAVKAERSLTLEDYRLSLIDRPRPGPGEVALRVLACALGYADVLMALGRYQVKPSLPNVPGGEVAGEIVEIGEGVGGRVLGERVIATARGGLAEVVLAKAGDVVAAPSGLSLEDACGLRVNYLTALHGLEDRAALRPGETLLVLGAAGGVGLAALQVGRALGARVIACASSPAKRDAVAAYADVVLDADPNGWRERLKAACGGGGPDVVFDPVSGPLFEPAFRSLAWRGRHLVIGFVGGAVPALPANLPLLKGSALTGVDVRQFAIFEAARAEGHLARLLAWAESGRIKPVVSRVFPLEAFAAAMTYAMSGEGVGKTVVSMRSAD